MAKYKVTVNYAGTMELLVEADDEKAAKETAEKEFDDVSAVELEANLEDIRIVGCLESDEESDDDT